MNNPGGIFNFNSQEKKDRRKRQLATKLKKVGSRSRDVNEYFTVRSVASSAPRSCCAADLRAVRAAELASRYGQDWTCLCMLVAQAF